MKLLYGTTLALLLVGAPAYAQEPDKDKPKDEPRQEEPKKNEAPKKGRQDEPKEKPRQEPDRRPEDRAKPALRSRTTTPNSSNRNSAIVINKKLSRIALKSSSALSRLNSTPTATTMPAKITRKSRQRPPHSRRKISRELRP